MYVPAGWFSDLAAWCIKVPVIGIVVVTVGIGVLFWSPWADIAPPGVSAQLPTQCIPQSMVSFTFDDGYESTYTKAFPILEKNGYKATAYVITGVIGQPGYLTLAQLQGLGKNGWWVGSHGISHTPLTELTPDQVWRELSDSKKTLKKWGFEAVDFASPDGAINDAILAQIKQLYVSHRTIDWGINQRPVDRYHLKYIGVNNQTPVEVVFDWIRRSKAEGGWLIVGFHRIDEEGPINYKSEDLERIVQFVKDQGFEGVCPFSNLE